MFSSMTSCPMAAFIMTLVMITVILDTYLLFGPLLVTPIPPLILGGTFLLLTVVYVLFTLWLSNRTCYKFVWVSWLIVLYLAYSIMYSLGIIIDPSKREKLQKEIDVTMTETPPLQ